MILVNHNSITTWSVNKKLQKILLVFYLNRQIVNKNWAALRCLLKDLIKCRFLLWHCNGKCLCKTRKLIILLSSICQYAFTSLTLDKIPLNSKHMSNVTNSPNLCNTKLFTNVINHVITIINYLLSYDNYSNKKIRLPSTLDIDSLKMETASKFSV